MRGHVMSRGPLGKPDKNGNRHHEGPPYTVVVELGEQPAQVCPVCTDKRGGHKLHWLEGRPLEKCPKCGGELDTVQERRQFTKSGFKLKREADAYLAKQLVSRNEGTYVEPSKLTVREFLVDEWLPAIKGSIKPSTYTSYEGHVLGYIAPELGAILLRKLTTSDVSIFYGKLAETKGGRGGQCLSPKTRRLIHITLRNALGYAVDAGHITRNAAASAKKPKVQRASLNVWTADHLRQFLAHVADDQQAAMWRTFASTGLRRGEVLGLQWRDVDFEHARLHIERSRVSVGYEAQVSDTKSGKGRNISLDAWTLKALKKWHAAQTLALGSKPAPDAWVFVDADGPIHPNKVTERFAVLQETLRREIVKRHEDAGAKGDAPVLPRIRLHDLRHTWATLALQAGERPKVVQAQLGHSTVAITMDTYSHVMPDIQEEAAGRVAALFSV